VFGQTPQPFPILKRKTFPKAHNLWIRIAGITICEDYNLCYCDITGNDNVYVSLAYQQCKAVDSIVLSRLSAVIQSASGIVDAWWIYNTEMSDFV